MNVQVETIQSPSETIIVFLREARKNHRDPLRSKHVLQGWFTAHTQFTELRKKKTVGNFIGFFEGVDI